MKPYTAVFLAALALASSANAADGLDAFVSLPGDLDHAVIAAKALNALGGNSDGAPVVMEEWDFETGKPKQGGLKVKLETPESQARAQSSGGYSGDEQDYGQVVVTISGSDMAANTGNVPLSVGLGFQSAKRVITASAEFSPFAQAFGGYGAGITVSPFGFTNWTVKPIAGYRYYKTHGLAFSSHDGSPANDSRSRGPTFGFEAPVHRRVDFQLQVVLAKGERTRYETEGGRKVIGVDAINKRSIVGTIVVNFKQD
jgi:hypothetical protein